MKKTLIIIFFMTVFGISGALAQQVDVELTGPEIEYTKIPVKQNPGTAYTLSAIYTYDNVGSFFDSLVVTADLDGDFINDFIAIDTLDSVAFTSETTLELTRLLKDTADYDGGNAVNATWMLNETVDVYTFTGTKQVTGTESAGAVAGALTYNVDVNDTEYSRYNGTPGGTWSTEDTNGSIGAAFEFVNDDVVEKVSFDHQEAVNTEYSVSVYTSGGTELLTTEIQLVQNAAGTEEVTLDLEVDGGTTYYFMINQKTAEDIDIVRETGTEGEVIIADGSGGFSTLDTTDVAITVFTVANTAPDIASVPGDQLNFFVGQAGEYTITATDVDGEDLTLSLADTTPGFNSKWLTFVDNGDGTGTISGTPAKANIGSITAVFSAEDALDSTTYSVTLRVSDETIFEVPYAEGFDNTTTPNGGVPASWTLLRDVDESGNATTWAENFNDEMRITNSADVQNEILVSDIIALDALDATADTAYLLSFDLAFNNTEDNWVGGILDALGSGSDGDGNFADLDVWIFASDSTIIWSENEEEEFLQASTGTNNFELDVTDYEGQNIRVAFQVTSNNPNDFTTSLDLDNVQVNLNEEVDLSVIVRSEYAELPASQIDETNGEDINYYIISRGYNIPDDATVTINVTGAAGGTTDADFEASFEQFTLDPADFVDGVYEGTVNVVPNFPDRDSNFGYQVSVSVNQGDNNATGATSESDILYVTHSSSQIAFSDGDLDNALSATVLSETADSEFTLDDTEGIGTVIELVNQDYFGGLRINFNGAGTADQTFKVDIISIADADATSGTIVATIDDNMGNDLNATSNEVLVINDEDYEEGLIRMDPGFYAIMVTPTNANDAEIEIRSTDPDDDRADYGSFVRGTADNITTGNTYDEAKADGDLEDDGDLDIRAYFGDPINLSVIAFADYTQVPRSQVDETNGYDFTAYVIKRGAIVPDDIELDLNISRDINGVDDNDFMEIDSIKVLEMSDFTNDTAVFTLNVMLDAPKQNEKLTYSLRAQIVEKSGTDNNATGSTDQTVSTGVEVNSNGFLFGGTVPGTVSVSSTGFGNGLGEYLTLVNSDNLEFIRVGWFDSTATPFSISIISVADENATGGTVVATMDDINGVQLTSGNGGAVDYVFTDDENIEKDVFLPAGNYVVMLNPVDPSNNVFNVQGAAKNDDRHEFGFFVRGKATNITRNSDEEAGNLRISFKMAENDAPQFFDPREGDINTAITAFDMRDIEGVAFTESVVVRDAQENDNISVAFVDTPPSFLTIAATDAGFDLIVDNTSTEGNYPLQVLATDGLDTAVLNVNIDITPNPAPAFTTAPTVIAFEGQAYRYIATGSDPLGENVTASFGTRPSWLTDSVSVSGDSLLLLGTPAAANIGNHAVRLILTDDSGNTAQQSFMINVFANSTPFFTSFPSREGNEGDAYSYRITASDNDGTAELVFTADSLPSGFTLVDNGNGIAQLTGDTLRAGPQFVQISVSDGLVSATQAWTIEVDAANQAPIFTSTTDAVDTVNFGVTYEYNITFEDPDGDNVQLSGQTLPNWVVLINEGTGRARLLGNPTEEQLGNHEVELSITDGQASATQSYTIVVGSPASNEEEESGEEETESEDTDDDTESSEDATSDEEKDTSDEESTADERTVEMYPNPAHDFLNIKTDKEQVTVTIYNQSGAFIKSVKMDEGSPTVNIQGIKPGIYLIRVGNAEKLHRVVIQ